MRGHAVRTDVVERLDEAAGEELAPEAVHRGPREERIGRRCEPLGGVLAVHIVLVQRIIVQQFRFRRAEELASVSRIGNRDASDRRNGGVSHTGASGPRRFVHDRGQVVHGLFVVAGSLGPRLGEEGGEAPEILLLPSVRERVDVAFAHMSWLPRKRAAAVPTILFGAGWPFSAFASTKKVSPTRRLIAAAGEHGLHDLVPGPIGIELMSQPFREDLVGLDELVVVRVALHEQVMPIMGEVFAVLLVRQQFRDEGVSFLGIAAFQEGSRLGCRGDDANDIKIGAADELAIVRDRRGRDFQFGKLSIQDCVDPGRDLCRALAAM